MSLKIWNLGQIDYVRTYRLQKILTRYRKRPYNELGDELKQLSVVSSSFSLPPPDTDILLLCEHNPGVYTTGKRDRSSDLEKAGCFIPTRELNQIHHASEYDDLSCIGHISLHKNAPTPVLRTARGGGACYHGSGQLMAYHIANIQSLHSKCRERHTQASPLRWYINSLEDVIIEVGKRYEVDHFLSRRKETAGLWSPWGKVAFMGLQLSQWVSMHGLSLNVTVECERPLSLITFCEQQDNVPCSIESLLRHKDGVAHCPPTVITLNVSFLQGVCKKFRLPSRNVEFRVNAFVVIDL